ncbi:hypothetical protein [Pseudomonas veronii]|uniref:hypothetical protein n=1 Tax=Pseudomonas veronii TaxID=76761 RepID=UPI0015A4BCA6|nr:hypothetical protein [Pseudomonas veronii]NWC59723.1 hypothetical protein [Pseudomonas veronii]
MPIATKKLVIDDKVYKIKQHPATEGCKLIEDYVTAIRAFITIQQEGTYVFGNSEIIPFIARLDCRFLAVLMFLDRLANPGAGYEAYERAEVQRSKYLTIAEIKAGTTIADRTEVVEQAVQSPLSYSVDYKATSQQESSVNIEAILSEFFKYITLDDEPVDLDSLTMSELTQMVYAFIEHNVLHLWTKNRWSLPDNYNSGGIAPPPSLARSAAGSSHAAIIYSILNSDLDLATYAELSTCLSVEDAYNMNELAVRQYFESCEMRKEAERQARNNQ